MHISVCIYPYYAQPVFGFSHFDASNGAARSAMVAGKYWDELAMHIKAARRNGLTVEEIKEILLQTAIYCSVPAANVAFSVAKDALAEYDEA